MSLAERVIAGDVLAAARLMRRLEDDPAAARQELQKLQAHTGRARIVGLTGPPGAGKSTLVSALAAELRRQGKTVGILAVDPSSPFSGGAILGDRIRMTGHDRDPGVFIRSVATRGHQGGLARSTWDMARVMDALGLDWILIETVGVGQNEVDVMRGAHLSVVVSVPGLGDEVQIAKAGLLEIGDVFVLNKADLPGAAVAFNQLHEVVHLQNRPHGMEVPILKTVAVKGEGLPELVAVLEERWQAYQRSGERQRRQRQAAFAFLVDELTLQIRTEVLRRLRGIEGLDAMLDGIAAGTRDLQAAAEELLDQLRVGEGAPCAKP